jgi:hypothetical protein
MAPHLLTSRVIPARHQCRNESDPIMSRLDSRMVARCSSAVLVSAVMAFGGGCAGRLYAVEGAPVVEDDGDVVYVQDPPVVDIETYPSTSYGGVYVYYVDGRWYQRGPRGWGYYRQEPPELGRQRQEHWQRDHDQRWADQPRADQPRAEHRGQEEHVAPPPAQRPEVTEARPPERRALPAQPPPAAQAQPRRDAPPPPAAQPQPRRDEMPAPPAQAAQPRRNEAPPPTAAKRPPAVRRAPANQPAPQGDRK